MTNQAQTPFLEEWLRHISSSGSSSGSPVSASARSIIEAWTELRDSLKHQSFQPNHFQSLRTLFDSQSSLFVADPQAKLLLSILSSSSISLPDESYPLFLRLLYIWIRKSTKPSAVLVDSAVEVVARVFSVQFDIRKSSSLLSHGILLLGAFSVASVASEHSKTVCLDLLCRLLEEEYQLIGSSDDLIPDILGGIGYALSSSGKVHFARILDSLLGIWGKEGGPHGNVSHGLIILHLIEWVLCGFISSHSLDKINVFSKEFLEMSTVSYLPFVVVMAAAGALRASRKTVLSGVGLDTISSLRTCAEERIEAVARDLMSKTGGLSCLVNDPEVGFLLHCVSLALVRSGPVSCRTPLFTCLASALLTEIFPLRRFYATILNHPHVSIAGAVANEVKEHLGSAVFREAGAITGVFCNQYVSIDEESKDAVENLIWAYCQEIYLGHRQVALMLQGVEAELLGDLEKITESAFLMIVVFALAVTKHRLNSKFAKENQMEVSIKILVSFSCVEYFRRMRLPEYMDTIRGVVVSVQENESACVSFVESMPSYAELTNQKGFSCLQKMEYQWYKDEVQTARILFYLRVIPTCVERLPDITFRKTLAPVMFLYMGHPNGKVARASHSMFVAFISSGKDANHDDRVVLKEQLVFYYIQRSLEGYPGITPFDGMASGVAALVQHLPAGSPAIFYTIHSIIEKANNLCGDVLTQEVDIWKNWQGESQACKKLLDLLLRLISLVDVQVLPNLLKLLAQLISQLPKDGQNMILNDIYSQISESDDVTRKPTLVSWVQSLSYLCAQGTSGSKISRRLESKEKHASASSKGLLSWNRVSSRL